jgi:hypothetical protein
LAKRIDVWVLGNRPHSMVDTAMPAQVWVWMMQFTVGLGHVDGAMDHEAGAVDAILELAEVGWRARCPRGRS